MSDRIIDPRALGQRNGDAWEWRRDPLTGAVEFFDEVGDIVETRAPDPAVALPDVYVPKHSDVENVITSQPYTLDELLARSQELEADIVAAMGVTR